MLGVEIIDQEKKVKHSKLASKTEEVITDPSKINVKLKVGARSGNAAVLSDMPARSKHLLSILLAKCQKVLPARAKAAYGALIHSCGGLRSRNAIHQLRAAPPLGCLAAPAAG